MAPLKIAEIVTAPPVPTPEEIAEADRIENERLAREEKRRKAVELERRGKAWEAFLERRGKRYLGCRLKTFDAKLPAQQAVVETLTAYGEALGANFSRGSGVVLIGPPGTGKDHLLIGLAMYAFRDFGWVVKWTNGADLYGEFRELIRNEGSENELLGRFTAPHILILSDPLPPFGALSEHQATMLFRIIDARYSACRPTWVTLNAADREDASKRMGPQVVDRLLHGATTLWCNWPSYRK